MSTKQARVEVYINDEQAQAKLADIQAELIQVKALRDKAAAAGDVKGFTQLQNETKKLTREANQLQRKVIDVKAVLNNLNGSSIKELQGALNKANMEFSLMKRNDPGFKRKAAEVSLLRTELNRATAAGHAQQSVWSKMASATNKYFTMITGIVALLTGFAFSAKEWVKGLVGMDDALANVMKTTGLTRKEVRELYTDFAYLNTRTARKELLLLAEEAGRLGKKTKKDVMEFVEVGNMIQVALGDDLGGNAAESIKEVGKLTNIYKIGAKYGTDFGDSMLKMGSAINEVSASSNTQAPFLIDMLKRMAGVTDQADLAAGSVIGYASALDQLGQTEEVSATALNKVIIDMFANTATYADIARMSVADFNKLLQTDSNEALLKFLEGLNGNSAGLTLMVQKFDELGVDGARSIQVLAALAGHTDLVRQEQVLANKALEEGTSLTNEYNIKNNNMAGNLEKIGHAIRKWFVNSQLNKSLEGIVGWFAKMVEIPVERKLQAEGKEVAILVGQLTNANTKAEERFAILEKLKQINPDIVAGLDAEKMNYQQLATNVAAYNDELVKRIVLSKLTAQEEELVNKAARRGAAAKEREIDLYQLMYQANTDIASSQGSIEEKVAKTVEYLVKMGASVDEFNRRSDITVNKAGQIVDKRSQEQRLLDEILTSQANRNDLLNRQREIEGDVKPIQERIAILKEMLATGTKAANTTTEVIENNTDAVIDGLDDQITAYAKLKEEISKLESELQHLVAANKPVPNSLIHELAKKKGDLAEIEQIIKSIGEGIGRMASIKAGKQLDEKLDPIGLGTRNDPTPEWIKNPDAVADAWREATISIAQTTSDTVFEIIRNRHQAELDLELNKLNTMRDAELSNKNLTEAQKDAINEKYRKRDLALRQEAFRKEKAAAIAQAIINGAVAITATYAEYGFTPFSIPAIIAQGIATAGQIAIIAAQKPPQYFGGGYTDEDPDDRQAVGIVHANEFVASAQAKRNPTVRPYLDVINQAQKAGTIRSLNLPAVMAAEKTAMIRASGYSQPAGYHFADADKMVQAVDRFEKVVQQLQDKGIEATLVYQTFKRMADKEKRAINKTS